MMKSFFAIPFVLGLLAFGSLAPSASSADIVQQERQVPSYAKWGQIAMSRVREKYPQANIVDYQHMGRTPGAASSTEKFKLWLKQGSREFGVFVDITFENKTEKIMSIKFRETTR